MWKEKQIHVNATESSFQRDEAHFWEPAYFDELAEDSEVIFARPRSVPFPTWEDLEGQGAR